MRQIVTFFCPVCGRVHHIAYDGGKLLIQCRACGNPSVYDPDTMTIPEQRSLQWLDDALSREDGAALNGYTVRLPMGSEVYMESGKVANLFLCNRFYYIPDINRFDFQSFVAKGTMADKLPMKSTLVGMLDELVPDADRTVDADRTLANIGSVRWLSLKRLYPKVLFLNTRHVV